MNQPTLTEIANRIDEHLKDNAAPADRTWAGAHVSGNRVIIQYVGVCYYTITRDQATKYLAWLDAGNIGKHLKLDIPSI